MKYNGAKLVPITETIYLESSKEMWVCNNPDTKGHSESIVFVFRPINSLRSIAIDVYGNKWEYVSEIPQPKKRDVTSLEVMEYLHLLQLYLDNGGQGNPCSLDLPIIDGRNASDYKFGLLVTAQTTLKKWHKYTIINEGTGMFDNKFGILKNGKVAEFDLPQIEIENES